MCRVLRVVILKKCSNASDPFDDTVATGEAANCSFTGSLRAKRFIGFLLALGLGLLGLILSPLIFGVALLAKFLEY